MTENKGRAVVTERDFHKGEFVCLYGGELIDEREANRRFKEYHEDRGSFMLSFTHEGKKLW